LHDMTYYIFLKSLKGLEEFRKNPHVPRGTMKLKRKEFADLKQGGMTVNEYLNSFIQLSRYAPDDINTDEKK
jgi:hypothetical protein